MELLICIESVVFDRSCNNTMDRIIICLPSTNQKSFLYGSVELMHITIICIIDKTSLTDLSNSWHITKEIKHIGFGVPIKGFFISLFNKYGDRFVSILFNGFVCVAICLCRRHWCDLYILRCFHMTAPTVQCCDVMTVVID